jgi:hypothetical protein
MGVEIIVPGLLFASVVLVVWIVSHFGARRISEVQSTLRTAIEKGQGLPQELIDGLAQLNPPNRDLRRAIISFAVAIPFAIMAVLIGQEDSEALRPLLGVASFPLSIGLAYLGLHLFANPKSRG